MTGERVSVPVLPGAHASWRDLSLPQPGGRAPAPGELVLVQSFINSHYDLVVEHGRDLLASPEALTEWFAQRRLMAPTDSVSREDARRVVTARAGLRALAYENRNGDRFGHPAALARLNRAARGSSLEVRFTADGPRFIAAARRGVDRALGAVLALTAEAMIDGRWLRMKACPGHDCGWVFYDHSRNQSGRWCSMSVCGARAKARSHYRRRRQGES